MKILHIITNTELGGAQNVCISLANQATKAGNTVAVASMDGGYLWEHLAPTVIPLKIKSMIKQLHPIADIKCFFELKRTIKNFQPDIIHLHSSKAGALGRLAGKAYKNSIVYTVHGFDSIRLKHRFFLPLEYFLQNYCGAIVPVSKYDEKNLIKEKITKNVVTIQNGTVRPDKKQVCPYKKGSYKKIIMTIARISKPKKFDSFLQIAADPQMQKYLFVWVGGSKKKTIETIKQETAIPQNVILLGDYDNASSLIEYCDLFVLFSNYEGLPITIIEAMAQHKAIVASNVGGIFELVDESNGILINTDDEAVSSIEKILSDEKKLQLMEQASYEKYLENFTVEKMWDTYNHLYQQIIERKDKIS